MCNGMAQCCVVRETHCGYQVPRRFDTGTTLYVEIWTPFQLQTGELPKTKRLNTVSLIDSGALTLTYALDDSPRVACLPMA